MTFIFSIALGWSRWVVLVQYENRVRREELVDGYLKERYTRGEMNEFRVVGEYVV